jgi:hypothetical protein
MRGRASLLVVVLGAVAGCAPRAVRPDELSASGHRAEAERERARAAEHQARFDPSASAPPPVRMGEAGEVPSLSYVQTAPAGNPTMHHLDEAKRHLAHAREHDEAAVALERFEDAACAGVPAAERAACPLLGPVRSVEDAGDAVRLRYAPGSPAAQLEARARQLSCQIAWARTRGFPASSCPISRRGVSVRVVTDAIDLVLADPRARVELRAAILAESSPRR